MIRPEALRDWSLTSRSAGAPGASRLIISRPFGNAFRSSIELYSPVATGHRTKAPGGTAAGSVDNP